MGLTIVEKKTRHFLNEWNKITTYDTSRLFFILFTSAIVGLPWIIYLLVICCILTYFLSYLIFKNYKSIGVLRFFENKIIIETEKLNVEIDSQEIESILLTHKSWNTRMSNRNKQVESNWIILFTKDKQYKLNFIFNSRTDYYDTLDYFDSNFKDNNAIKALNLNEVGIDDFIRT